MFEKYIIIAGVMHSDDQRAKQVTEMCGWKTIRCGVQDPCVLS